MGGRSPKPRSAGIGDEEKESKGLRTISKQVGKMGKDKSKRGGEIGGNNRTGATKRKDVNDVSRRKRGS